MCERLPCVPGLYVVSVEAQTVVPQIACVLLQYLSLQYLDSNRFKVCYSLFDENKKMLLLLLWRLTKELVVGLELVSSQVVKLLDLY